MSEDKEFLEQMWKKVEIHEAEEKQMARLLKEANRSSRKQIYIYFALSLIFMLVATLSVFLFIDMPIVFFLSLIVLTWSMHYEFKTENYTRNSLGGE